MIATLILSYPKAIKRIGAVLAILVVAALLYWMGVGGAWVGNIFPALVPGIESSPELTRAVAAIVFALLIGIN